MIKTGISGGMINLKSFLNSSDRNDIKNSNLRLANIREAAKDGLTSLYAEVDDVLDKYKDTDVIKLMNELRDEKLLWVRARAIDADTVNANGDYFAKAELLKEVDIIQTDSEGKKVKTKGPAYKTFEGVPMYANHKNDDVLEAKGMVIHAEWDDSENCVYTVFYIDESAYPDIARGIRIGYMHDVSMGCQVEQGECSECGNIAATEKDYCDCLKKYKGKIHPKSGKKVYEKNMGLKFIELSVVGDGAFPTCEIEEIYDKDEILTKAVKIEKKASELHANIMLAASSIPSDLDKQEYETILREVNSAANVATKIAQTLVGGPLLAGAGAGQNATVSNILKFLGIDPASGLNILDMLNLSLNFLEVAIINMFARKDNVDLTHVSKISKSMADLQATMEDLINDGVGTENQQAQAPINQGQLQAPAAPAAAPETQTAPQSYSPAGGVGQLMTQNQSFVLPPEMQQANKGIGGGALASSKRGRAIIWSHNGEEVSRVATASSNNKVGKAMENLASALGVSAQGQEASIRAAENNQPIKTNTPVKVAGGKKSMSIWDKFVQQRRLKQAAKATEKFEIEDKLGNKIVISSKGEIEAYHNNVRVAWEPNLTDNDLESIASGNGLEIASDFLGVFSNLVSTAKSKGKTITAGWQPLDDVYEIALDPLHKGSYDSTIEELLGGNMAEEYKRSDVSGEETIEQELESIDQPNNADEMLTMNELLSEKAGLYGPNFVDNDVKEALLEDARRGNSDEVINEQLQKAHMEHSASSASEVVRLSMEALASAVVAAKVTPEEIVNTAIKLATQKNFVKLVKLAQLGNVRREVIASRRQFHNVETNLTPVSAIYNELGKIQSVSASDIKDIFASTESKKNAVVGVVTASAQSKIKDAKINPSTITSNHSRTDVIKAALASIDAEEVSREHLKTSLMAFAASAEDSLVTPSEVVASISEISADELSSRIELAKADHAVTNRVLARARKDFYGSQRFASQINVAENTIGWLADYAMEFNQSSKSVAEAASMAIQNPRVAENLVNRLIEANVKSASVQITDEKIVTKRITCTVEDLGGIDPKSDDFEDQFRQKAIDLLVANGYTVDPNTFSLNEVSVSPDGYITASVTSRFTKTFKADADVNDSVDMQDMPMQDSDSIVNTDSAQELRSAKRKEILSRFAQVVPGMGGSPAMPSMPAMPGTELGAGLSALTTPMADIGAEQDQDTDEMPEPGKKLPVGTICPACGSKNVDLSNGNGHCNSCGTDMEISYQITIKPNSDSDIAKGESSAPEAGEAAEPAPMEPMAPAAPAAPAMPEMPAAPATPGLGGGAVAGNSLPIMVRISYTQDPEVFISATSPDFDVKTAKQLPVGHICPSCGNREAKLVQNNRFCYSCGDVYIPRVHKSSKDPKRVSVSIDKIV